MGVEKIPWETKLAILQRYKEMQGTAVVPTRYIDPESGFRLGGWVHHLRQTRSKLTAQQVQILESMGFVWNASKERPWEIKLAALRRFYEQHHHFRVPRFHVDEVSGFKLGQWIPSLRRKDAALKPARRRDLEQLGFFAADSSSPSRTNNNDSNSKSHSSSTSHQMNFLSPVAGGGNSSATGDSAAVMMMGMEEDDSDFLNPVTSGAHSQDAGTAASSSASHALELSPTPQLDSSLYHGDHRQQPPPPWAEELGLGTFPPYNNMTPATTATTSSSLSSSSSAMHMQTAGMNTDTSFSAAPVLSADLMMNPPPRPSSSSGPSAATETNNHFHKNNTVTSNSAATGLPPTSLESLSTAPSNASLPSSSLQSTREAATTSSRGNGLSQSATQGESLMPGTASKTSNSVSWSTGSQYRQHLQPSVATDSASKSKSSSSTTPGCSGSGTVVDAASHGNGVRANVAKGMASMRQPLENLKAQPTTLNDSIVQVIEL